MTSICTGTVVSVVNSLFKRLDDISPDAEVEENPELPVYFQAFLYEVLRCSNVCQISMAHAVAKEKFLKGYR